MGQFMAIIHRDDDRVNAKADGRQLVHNCYKKFGKARQEGE